MDVREITKIVELMSRHDLTEIDINSEGLSLTIKRERRAAEPPRVIMSNMPAMAASTPMMPQPQGNVFANHAPAPETPGVAETTPAKADVVVESPLVGTFYAAASPESAPFVQVGDRVTPDTVVCIVEAMKVMNEIKAEKSGVIAAVLVENAQPVEFGQPLFRLESA